MAFEDEMPEIYIDFPNDRTKSGRYFVESVCQDHVPAPLYFVVTGADEENNEIIAAQPIKSVEMYATTLPPRLHISTDYIRCAYKSRFDVVARNTQRHLAMTSLSNKQARNRLLVKKFYGVFLCHSARLHYLCGK